MEGGLKLSNLKSEISNLKSAPRRGISLLEVLIATFVLSVGLLGLAVLIPAGQVTMLKTTKADRSAACGRAGLADVKIRRMLEAFRPAMDDPSQEVQMWLRIDDLGPGDPADVDMKIDQSFDLSALNEQEKRDFGPVCIDPWGIAKAAQQDGLENDSSATGEYNLTAMRTFPALVGPPPSGVPFITMPRVTLGAVPEPDSQYPQFAANPLSLAQAERIFMWRDDLEFVLPEERDQRPHTFDTNGNDLDDDAPEPTGNYTWMVTLVPNLSDAGLGVKQRQLYNVSIVVFFNRDPIVSGNSAYDEKRAELVFRSAIFVGPGIGGGSIVLDDVPITLSGDGQADVREDEWVMLCGEVDDTRYPGTGGQQYEKRQVFQWYRVVSTGTVDYWNDGSPTTLLTLAGPDWTIDNDNNGQPDNVQVVIVKGVLGVYTKTVELNSNTVWTR